MTPGGIDRWGAPVAGNERSVQEWDNAWEEMVHFHGDPLTRLVAATEADEHFALGAVCAALYTALAGTPLADPRLATWYRLARSRARTGRELAHLDALSALLDGELTAAASEWAATARTFDDFAAFRFSHDVHLHVGAAEERLAASEWAVTEWLGRPWWGLVAGQHSFSLNEVGRFEAAAEVGRAALAADPDDLWARHAVAHVFEETGDTAAMVALLAATTDRWQRQDLLAHHVWWHLAVRLLAAGDADEALAISDRILPTSTTAFRLCDQTALLWRAELAGVDVGARWDTIADRWDAVTERHWCGFIDVHASLAFLRRPHHPGAARWRDGLARRETSNSELDRIMADVTRPLVAALADADAGRAGHARQAVAALGERTCRIGGSNAQRAIIGLTLGPNDTTNQEAAHG